MGAVGVPPDEPDSETADVERGADAEAERVIRHRMSGHTAALELAEQLDRPDELEPHVEETEHRLAEDQDILDQIRSEGDE